MTRHPAGHRIASAASRCTGEWGPIGTETSVPPVSVHGFTPAMTCGQPPVSPE